MSAPKPVCVDGFPGIPASTMLGRPKVRVIEDIEELRLQPELHVLGQREPFGQIEITPDKIGTAQRVAAEVSELAVLRAVSAVARAGARVDGGDKRIGIEPLNRAGLRHAGNGMVLVQRHTRNDARELRSTALHDAISIR